MRESTNRASQLAINKHTNNIKLVNPSCKSNIHLEFAGSAAAADPEIAKKCALCIPDNSRSQMCPGMSRNMGSGYLVEMIVHIFLSNFESQLFQVFSRVLCARLDSLQIFSNFQQVIVLGRSQSQFVVRFPAISGQPTHFSYPCSQVAVLSELAILGRTFSRQFVKWNDARVLLRTQYSPIQFT